jgi:hypothetical protein
MAIDHIELIDQWPGPIECSLERELGPFEGKPRQFA